MLTEKKFPGLDLDMVVLRRETKKTAGKPIVFKLVLEDGNKNRLTLVGDSSAVFEGFPENVMFQVKVRQIQAILAKSLEHMVEEHV